MNPREIASRIIFDERIIPIIPAIAIPPIPTCRTYCLKISSALIAEINFVAPVPNVSVNPPPMYEITGIKKIPGNK